MLNFITSFRFIFLFCFAILMFNGITVTVIHSGKAQIKHDWETWNHLKIDHDGSIRRPAY